MAGKMASRKKKEKAFNVLAFFIVLILAALVLLPIWWIFRSSLMSTAALNEYPPSFIPHEWLWSNYSKALETFEYWTYFKNTFTIIIPALPLVPSLRFFADMPLQDFVSAGKS